MNTFFLISFGAGGVFVLLTAVLGGVSGMFDFDVDTGTTPSPFKPILIALFFMALGGAGLIIQRLGLHPGLALAAAAVGGLVVTLFAFRFIYIPMYKMQNTNIHDRKAAIGHRAKVTEQIPAGGFGKITYTINEKIVSGPAKSEDGNEIKKHTDVVIVFIEKNTYHVRIFIENGGM